MLAAGPPALVCANTLDNVRLLTSNCSGDCTSGSMECLRHSNGLRWHHQSSRDDADKFAPTNKETGHDSTLSTLDGVTIQDGASKRTAIARLCLFSSAIAIRPPNMHNPETAAISCSLTCPIRLKSGPMTISPTDNAR